MYLHVYTDLQMYKYITYIYIYVTHTQVTMEACSRRNDYEGSFAEDWAETQPGQWTAGYVGFQK